MCSSERGQFASLLWEDDRNAEKSHSVSCVGTEACIGSQKSLWWCWAVFLLVLSDSIEETVNLPPYEYSTALEHFTRFFRGNGPWGQSLLDKSRLASCYCSDPIAPTWGLAFLRGSPSSLSVSLWRTHWSVACRADGSGSAVHFLIILHVGLLPWACDHRAFCSTSLLCSALFCLSRRFGHSPSSLARSLCMLRKSAKWHPGGNQKHALASLSLLLEIIWDYVRFLALRWLQANTQACTNARKGIKAGVLCCGKVLITEAQKVGTGLLTQSTQS